MSSVYYTTTSGKDVEQLVGKIEKVIEGKDTTLIQIACLSIVLMIQEPNLTTEQLLSGVKGISEWMSMFFSAPTDPKQAN